MSSGESSKPFRCTMGDCEKAFKRKSELNRHIRERHGHYLSCPVPGCTWGGSQRRWAVRTHINSKHPGYRQIPVNVPDVPAAQWGQYSDEFFSFGDVEVREASASSATPYCLSSDEIYSSNEVEVTEKTASRETFYDSSLWSQYAAEIDSERVFCPFPGCNWRGSSHPSRVREHINRKHPGYPQMPIPLPRHEFNNESQGAQNEDSMLSEHHSPEKVDFKEEASSSQKLKPSNSGLDWRSLLEFTLSTGLSGMTILPFFDADELPYQQPYLAQNEALTNKVTRFWNKWTKDPPLKHGLKRITWTCTCGTSLYDDFEELVPGAAKALQKRLRQDHIPRHVQRSAFPSPAKITEVVSSILSAIGGIPSALSATFGKGKRESPSLPSYQLESQSQRSGGGSQQTFPTEDLYLVMCIDDGIAKSVPKAYQPPVHHLRSDKELFQTMKRQYLTTNKKWWSWLSIRQLQGIHFIGFELYERSLVDVKEINSLPPDEYQREYRYEPCKVNPPIGSNLLLHNIQHPDHASETTACFQKVPKKLNGELVVCPDKGVSPGWGLHFEEGWCWRKILTGSCVVILLSVLLEAALYVRYEHSVQDAMAVGTFILACAALVVATLQAWVTLS